MIRDRTGASQKHSCKSCKSNWSPLWLSKGMCVECEEQLRHAGQCPFNEGRCKKSWFCPHEQRCFVCDEHSCELCRLHRGDSGIVSSLAKELQPTVLAFDFDRTLSTSKAGAKPLIGKHSVDEELVALLWEFRGRARVVTRNSHKKEISEFLEANGAPEGVEVFVVPKKVSKARYLGEGEGKIVFVDDSIKELVENEVVGNENIHRVLFVRL